jgi:hypothetical protein
MLTASGRPGESAEYQHAFAETGPRGATAIPAVDTFASRLPEFEVAGRRVELAGIAFVQKRVTGLRLACD